MITLFKILIAVELIVCLVLLVVSFRSLRTEWKTTLAGLCVLAVTLFVNGMYFARTGGIYDMPGLAINLAIAIAFFICPDGQQREPRQ